MKQNKLNGNSIKIIKPLYKLTTFLAITPVYNFEAPTEPPSIPQKIHNVLTLISIPLSFLFSTYFRFTGASTKEKYATQTFIITASHLILSISNLSACFGIRLTHREKLVELLNNFQSLNCVGVKIGNWRFYAELIFCCGIMILYTCYDELYLALVYRQGFQFSVFIRKPQTFFSLCLAMLIHNFGLQFKYQFNAINNSLKHFRETRTFPGVGENSGVLFGRYVKLAEMVDLFNEIFGWQIGYLSADFVLGLLYSINDAIVEINETNITEISVHFWINCCIYSIVVMLLCVPFASSCNDAAEEAKRTPLLCYTILSSANIEATKIKDLESLASVESPKFSAAGFFDVDHTALFTLFGSVTGYLIVLIQLKDIEF